MKIPSSTIIWLFALSCFADAQDKDVVLALRGGQQQSGAFRSLSTISCSRSRLGVNEELGPNEPICANIGGDDVYFGIFSSPMAESGYTMYRIELRSSNRAYNRLFSGVGTRGDAPTLKLQGDANLLFGTQGFSGCIAMPGTSGRELTIGDDGNGGLQLQITDSTNEVVWRLFAQGGCYPLVQDSCAPALYKDERLSWKQYLCTYNQHGDVEYRFGLNADVGLFGLWKENSLIWRPAGGSWIRGDYLHFQDDGHVTVYRNTSPKTYVWTSDDCIDYTAEKIVLTSDGDVQEVNHAGAIVWSLQGSKAPPSAAADARDSVPQICMPSTTCGVPPTTPLFIIDDNVDIGDILIRPGPAFAGVCGPRCYDVRDSGDDPPLDPELGDTLRFAYKEISSSEFVFRAKVCGTGCFDGSGAPDNGFLGSVGLMVRESLDPLARNLFVSHEPDGQATWSYRLEHRGASIRDFDGSPDVECLWITLERHSTDVFKFFYNYEDDDGCAMEGNLVETEITINNMPETILLGIGVSSGIAPPYCAFTEARFSNIQLEEF